MKIGESIFDIIYLFLVVGIGIYMIRKSEAKSQYRLFGIMSVVLGLGDAFHLVPRVYSMWTTGLSNNAVALGFGQAVTSVTMTAFYVILYHIWRKRYQITESRGTMYAVYTLSAVRIMLCLFPQNDWLSKDAPLSWGIYRNIPFAMLGILLIILFYRSAKESKDKEFRYMWLAIVLSFAFYAPVVLFAKTFPPVGALMMPKTCAYVWIVIMGLQAMTNSRKK